LLPPRADTGRTRRDSRPHALLALALLALYGAIVALPATRAFFDLAPLSPLEHAAVAGAVALGSVLLWWVRRRRLLLRFLGVLGVKTPSDTGVPSPGLPFGQP
jgi:hypothetical protein